MRYKPGHIEQPDSNDKFILSFGRELSYINHKSEFYGIIGRRLQVMLRFTYFTIFILDEDGDRASNFLFDTPGYKEKVFSQYVKTVNITQVNEPGKQILNAANPVVLDWSDTSGIKQILPYLKLNEYHDIKSILIVNLFKGDQIIGNWIMLYDSREFINIDPAFLKLIGSHLTLGLAHLITLEKLKQRERENEILQSLNTDFLSTVNDQLNEINKYKQRLEGEQIDLNSETEASRRDSDIIGDSEAMKKVFALVSRVAPSDSTVLILGETGTGKELIARAIHKMSPRENKAMVKVNCAALPASLIESELFGHEKGSFTGAIDRRIGKFEMAHQGTLFLDEIGEMPPELQVKMLRALQEKEIERIGGKNTIKIDVRIIAATNRDLLKEMAEGKFRSDLYYRLNIFPIQLPPLRHHREDIPLLAAHFIRHYSRKTGKRINTFSHNSLEELMQYDWPGNVREFEHLIERSILLATGESIQEIHLPNQSNKVHPLPDRADTVIKTLDENERDHILDMLKFCKGRIAGKGGAAALLGVPPSTLNSKIKRLGIRREHLL